MIRKLLIFILSILTITGCASDGDFAANDVMFAEMMIPHHEQAIVMSDIALTNTTTPEILALAQQIKDAQAPEIETMKSWPGVDAMAHMGHMMSGMLSEAEIDALRAANGEEFDRLFLEGMIKHHEGAIEMAEDVIDSKNSEVANLANAIIEAQRLEIAEMKALLAKTAP
jgi:uncharacterized protein (DUF305 family)